MNRAVARGSASASAVMVLLLTAVLATAQTTQDSLAEPEPPSSPTLIQLIDPLDEPQSTAWTCRGSEPTSIWTER